MNHVVVRLAVRFAPLLVPAFVACIEVGHDAETGCLVDQSAPGCRAAGRGGSAAGGASSGGTTTGGASGSGGRGGSSTTGGSTSTGGSTGPAGAAGVAPEGGEGGA